MPDLADGETAEVRGSAAKPYLLKNTGGVYSCTCPAWRNQSVAIERRTCKHLRQYRGEEAETDRVGSPLAPAPAVSESKAVAPPLLLAETWTEDVDPSGWFLSEKLDGVRAWWDGTQFLSRNGNRYHAPDWFTAGLPATPLDGELWLGRKQFQATVAIVRRQDGTDAWRQIRFVVFDAPHVPGSFEERLRALAESLPAGAAACASILEQTRCRDRAHLAAELARIEELGGEGLMLRQPGSLYVASRSATLLKVKSFRDGEATVIGHQPGTGRHRGRLGALLVRLESGVECAVGTGFSDAQREQPPAVGTVITMKYQELTDAGVPRFPVFVAVRSDPPRADSPAVVEPQVVPAAAASGSPRRFELVAGSSSKFWSVEQSAGDVTVRYGRIGTTGQTTTKSFPDEAAARAHAEKLIREKTGKGYVEIGS